MTRTKFKPILEWDYENLELVHIRFFPSVIARVEKIIAKDKGEHWDSLSHFVRCAVNNYLQKEDVKKYIFRHRKVFKQTKK